MATPTIEARVHDFLPQKRIAAVYASRNNCGHLVANLFDHRRGQWV
jgi:hypothetical protein